jgi:hypothetical protein
VTGVSASITLGEENAFIDVGVAVIGQELNTDEGSVTVDLNTPVDLTGQQLTVSLNNTKITAWEEIDPGVSNVWTEIDPGVSNVWTEVDLAA